LFVVKYQKKVGGKKREVWVRFEDEDGGKIGNDMKLNEWMKGFHIINNNSQTINNFIKNNNRFWWG
jgi:hypothetical protein